MTSTPHLVHWTRSDKGFITSPFQNADIAAYSLCVFGSKVYVGTKCYDGSGTTAWARVYESTDGISWALNKTFDEVGHGSSGTGGDHIASMCVFGGKLYALRGWNNQTRLYETSDAVNWSLTKDLYTSNGSTNPRHIMTDGSKLYVAGVQSSYNSVISATTPSGTWTNELNTNGKLSGGTKVVQYNSDLFAIGNYSTITNGVYIYRKTAGSWDSGTQFINTTNMYDGCVFNNKLYFIGNDKAGGGLIYLYAWDGSSWTTAAHVSDTGNGGNLTAFTSADNLLFISGRTSLLSGQTYFNHYVSSDGIDFTHEQPYGHSNAGDLQEESRTSVIFQKRTFIGAGAGNLGAGPQIYYTTPSQSSTMVLAFN